MPFFKVEQTSYHYNVAGAGEPLVMLHGFTGCTENWRDVMRRLATKWRVIAIDLPGHGKTEAPRDVAHYRMPVVAHQISEFITTVAGKPAHVLGYSMGGRLALSVALNHPGCVQGLILESASPGLATDDERLARTASDEALAQRIERDGIQKFVDEWERLPLFASQLARAEEARLELRARRLRRTTRPAWRSACAAWALARSRRCGIACMNGQSRRC